MTADIAALEAEVAAVNEKFAEFTRRRDEVAEMQLRATIAQGGYVEDVGEWEDPDELVAESVERRPVADLPPFPTTVAVPNAAALVERAMEMAAQQIPDWGVHAPQVTSRIQQNPAALGAAVQTGDPAQVAATLASVYQATKTSDANRLMKLAAQSAVGASGRPAAQSDDAAEWSRVMAAKSSVNYWD